MKMSWYSKHCWVRSVLQQNIDGQRANKEDEEEKQDKKRN